MIDLALARASMRRHDDRQTPVVFVEQLLDALAIPEVAALVAAALPAARPSPRPSQPTGRGRGRR